jgi:hypothetical protein
MVLVDGVLNVASKTAPSIFTLGRIIKVVCQGSKITNSLNLITVVANVTLTAIECCGHPPTPPPL